MDPSLLICFKSKKDLNEFEINEPKHFIRLKSIESSDKTALIMFRFDYNFLFMFTTMTFKKTQHDSNANSLVSIRNSE